MSVHGGGPGLADFQFAFFAISAFSLAGVLPMLTLGADAGASVSGHGVPDEIIPEPVAKPASQSAQKALD